MTVSVTGVAAAAVEPVELFADPRAVVLADLVGVVAVVEVRGDGQPALRREPADEAAHGVGHAAGLV